MQDMRIWSRRKVKSYLAKKKSSGRIILVRLYLTQFIVATGLLYMFPPSMPMKHNNSNK